MEKGQHLLHPSSPPSDQVKHQPLGFTLTKGNVITGSHVYSFGFYLVLLSLVLPGQASAMLLKTHLDSPTPFALFLKFASRALGTLNK